MTSDQTHRRINICIENDEENVIHTLDVFGHRITPLRGYALEDIMIYLAVIGLSSYRANSFTRSILTEISTHGLHAPFATMQPGAIVYAADSVCSGDYLIQVKDEVIHLPDGRKISQDIYDRKDFFDQRLQRQLLTMKEKTMNWVSEKDPRTEIMLALMVAAQPLPFKGDTIDRLAAVYSRIVRLADLNYASGAAGSFAAQEAISSLWGRLVSHWFLEPDHINFPETLVPNEDLSQALKSNVKDQTIEMCRTILQAAEGATAEDLRAASAAKRGDDLGMSAHQSLQMFSAVQKLDAAIEATLPLDMLKPAARKRQKKARSA